MRRIRGRWSERIAFTLIELLVVVAIIALLAGILLPSLARAREQAREKFCAAQLSQFGRGFYAYATANRDCLCSGSFDPDVSNGRDGPPDRIGWVADLVNTKTAFPGKMLCPSNPAQFNQKLDPGSSNSGSGFTTAQADSLVARGYNTNYCQSWYMARTEVRPLSGTDKTPNVKKVDTTLGPLNYSRLLRVSACRVPILGDGGIETKDAYHGQPTVKTMTDGPSVVPYGIQTYSDFGPAHGIANTVGHGLSETNRDRANILFADGHIDPFVDRNGSNGQPPRNGQFGINEDDPDYPFGTQEDLSPATVFDGVISLARRSTDPYSRQ